MTVQTFRGKPVTVQAVQWRGDNAEEMTALAGPDFDYDTVGGDDLGAALRTSKHSTWEPMYIGDWAVRGGGGSLARVDAQDFAAQYEPAAAGMLTVSGECGHPDCVSAGRRKIYRMVGSCGNCQTQPILMLFTAGHDARALKCPVCGVSDRVYAQRPATDEEIPASEAVDADA